MRCSPKAALAPAHSFPATLAQNTRGATIQTWGHSSALQNLTSNHPESFLYVLAATRHFLARQNKLESLKAMLVLKHCSMTDSLTHRLNSVWSSSTAKRRAHCLILDRQIQTTDPSQYLFFLLPFCSPCFCSAYFRSAYFCSAYFCSAYFHLLQPISPRSLLPFPPLHCCISLHGSCGGKSLCLNIYNNFPIN